VYCRFFGLTAPPFSLLPDTGAIYPSKSFMAAKDILEYAFVRREGVFVLTGEVGCGKSLLVHDFLRQAETRGCIGAISNPSAIGESPIMAVLLAFNQQLQTTNEVLLHAVFRNFIKTQHAQGQATMLVIDEAQDLSINVLEKLRMLTNPEVGGGGMLQLVLVGQANLRQTLQRPELDQLLQRVVASQHIEPMSQIETALYITYRLEIAGRHKPLFTLDAMAQVFQGAHGIPRLVNMICDSALLYGYTEGRDQIDAEVIDQVITDRGVNAIESPRRLPGATNAAPGGVVEKDGSSALDRDTAVQLFRVTKK
jgi:type II secretory pathway predicted ATPase ExeA